MTHLRRYKPGYSPAELGQPFPATCGKCGRDDATFCREGLICPTCSPSSLVAFIAYKYRPLDRTEAVH